MSKEEAIEILSEMRSEYNLFGDEEEATRYHVLSWAIKAMNAETVKNGEWIVEAECREDLVDGHWFGGEELVRCKDCAHYAKVTSSPMGAYDMCGLLQRSPVLVSDETYCAWGWRREL